MAQLLLPFASEPPRVTSVVMDSRTANSLTLSWTVSPRQQGHVWKYEVTYSNKVTLLNHTAATWGVAKSSFPIPAHVAISPGETEP